jgi:hypothetical protein
VPDSTLWELFTLLAMHENGRDVISLGFLARIESRSKQSLLRLLEHFDMNYYLKFDLNLQLRPQEAFRRRYLSVLDMCTRPGSMEMLRCLVEQKGADRNKLRESMMDMLGRTDARSVDYLDSVVGYVPGSLTAAVKADSLQALAIFLKRHHPLSQRSTAFQQDLTQAIQDVWQSSYRYEFVSEFKRFRIDVPYFREDEEFYYNEWIMAQRESNLFWDFRFAVSIK